MKIAFDQILREPQNQEAQTLSNEQSHQKDASGIPPVPFQQKSVICIVQTILRTYHSDGTVDKTLRSKVFFCKPLLTHQGKLDKEKLLLEILFRR
jgi:hypothetical protein